MNYFVELLPLRITLDFDPFEILQFFCSLSSFDGRIWSYLFITNPDKNTLKQTI